MRLCKEVNLADMSETAIATACNHVILSGAMISHGNCTELLSALLLQKVNFYNRRHFIKCNLFLP